MAEIRPTKHYLSPVQAAIFDYLKGHLARFGFSPTQAEIAKALGIGRTGVEYHLHQLALKGLVDKRGKARRNLVITNV